MSRMQLQLCIFLLFQMGATIVNAQDHTTQRKGFSIGIGIGAGTLNLNTNDTLTQTFSTSLPNLKIGYAIHPNWSILLQLPGANYRYEGKDRGFEAIMLSTQYWMKKNWWLNAGLGLSFDAAAFYTVKDPKTAGFYTGLPALSFTTGYEIWHRGRFAIDLQYRFFTGNTGLQNNGFRKGFSNMFLLGFNWY
jgi:hypothetical protein